MARKHLQVASLETVEDDMNETAVTLSDAPDGINIWLESADGDCSHTFNEEQFNALVEGVRKLKGWVA